MNSNDPFTNLAENIRQIREMEAIRMNEAIEEFNDGLDEDTRRRRKTMNDPNRDIPLNFRRRRRDDGLWKWEAKAFALDTGECPECEGHNLNEDRTKCWDCDPGEGGN